METRRLELQATFESFVPNVYFDPPENMKLTYPAIVYRRRTIDIRHASDASYMQSPNYEVTVIDPDPRGGIAAEVAKLPMCAHNRFFKSDNLNHDVFIIY